MTTGGPGLRLGATKSGIRPSKGPARAERPLPVPALA